MQRSKVMQMKLCEEPFMQIYNGEKTVEVRLNDEKRRQLAVGDTIIFTHIEDENRRILTEVLALYKYASFAEMFRDDIFDKCGCAGMSADEATQCMYSYYTKEEEASYGVLGIEIKVLEK